jgi:uncharacterized protein YndB with AHSA1/START domain
MAAKGSFAPTPATTDRQIVSTRVFDAPLAQLFKAFSEPDHLAHWWGPKGFTSTFHEFDMRPGGAWRFVMHGPDGTDYPNESIFVEVVKPERIVFDHILGHHFQMTVTLAEQGGKTRVTWHMLFDSAAECDEVKALVADANEQNFDRLEAQLARMT